MNRRLLAAVLALTLCGAANATEILRWERLPLAVPLVVGQERILFVDRNVRIGVPASVGTRLRVQSAAGAVYLLAHEPIEPVRLQLQDADTGTVILVDIAAEAAVDDLPPLEPVRIVDAPTPHAAGDAGDHEATAPTQPAHATPVPVVLTRYAAQTLYAPLR
ncbi:MAG: TIGR03749 family integrating conjugative element protein, partial [Pseudomonas sp.]|nr:TIGR03749 family integrating conjugative element protein [Pseudomonas sp.]